MASTEQSEASGNSEKICVAIRMRPLNEREKNGGQEACFRVDDEHNSIVQLKDGVEMNEHRHYYDRAFDPESSTDKVYEYCGQDLVSGVVKGISGTIFAYGQTSSGKTYTMSDVSRMASEDIFRHITESENRQFILKVSYVEIYNENLRDLLSDSTDTSLNIREDPKRGVYCEAVEFGITSFEDISRALKKGIDKRTVESTAMNATSSRSHTIFKIYVESREIVSEDGSETDGAVLIASLNLVDLAGSESVRHTGAQGQRAKEGGKINQSLLSLSRVIHALSTPGAHVGFRDSKLTRLLQPSLSGEAKMSVICCITPAERFLEETRSTLAFASRAKLVTTHATVNEVLDEAAKIRRLEKEVMLLRQIADGNGANIISTSSNVELLERIDGYEKKLQRLQYLATTTGSGVAFVNGNENASPNSITKRPTQVYSTSKILNTSTNNMSVDVDSLRRSFVLPMDVKDTHEMMVQREEALKNKMEEMMNTHAMELQAQEEKAGENFCDMEDALNGTIEELEEKIQELNETIETTVASKQEKESELGAQVESLKAERDSMTVSLEEKQLAFSVQLKDLETAALEKEGALNQQIESLTSKVAKLEAESESAKKSHEEELASVHAQIEEKSSEAQAQLDGLQADLAIATSTLEEKCEKVTTLENDLKTLDEITQSMEADLTALNSTVAELEQELSEKNDKVCELQSQLEAAEAQLESDITMSYTGQAETALEIKSLNETISSLEGQVTTFKDENAKVLEELSTIKCQKQDQDACIEEKDKELSIKVAELASLNDEYNASKGTVRSLQSELDVYKESLEAVEKTKSDLQSTITKLDDEINALKESTSSTDSHLARENSKLFDALQEAKAQAATKEEHLTSQLGVKDAEISKMMSQCKELGERMHLAEQVVAKNQVENEATASDEEAFKKRISILQTQVDLLSSEKESMSIKLKEFEVELRDIKAQSSVNEERLSSELETANVTISKLEQGRSEVGSMSEAIKALEGRVNAEKEEKTLLQESIDALLEEKTALVKELDGLQSKFSSSQESNDSDDVVQQLNEEIAILEKDALLSMKNLKEKDENLAELTIRYNKTKEQATQMLQEWENADETIKSLEAELAELKENGAVAVDEVVDCSAYVEEIAGLKENIQNLEERLNDNKEFITSMTEERDTNNAEIIAIKQRLSKSDERAVELNEMVLTMRAQRENSEARCEQVEAEKQELVAQLEKTTTSSAGKGGDDAEKAALIAELNSLMEKDMEKEAKITAAEAKSKDLQQQIREYDRTSAKDQEMIMEAANLEMEQLRSDLSTEKRELLSQLQEAQSELSEATSANSQLQDEILSIKKSHQEVLETKEKRIEKLEQSKLTQDQMEKIKILKNDRKKFYDDCRILKKQLQQLKLAYDNKDAQLKSVMADNSNSGTNNTSGSNKSDVDKIAKLTSTLREVSAQLKEYEDIKREIRVLTESLGIEDPDLDASATEDNSILDWDLVGAVKKLGDAYTQARYMASESPETLSKLTQLETDLAKRTIELMEEIEKKDAIAKRLESAKSVSKMSKEEVSELRQENDMLKEKIGKFHGSVDAASSEMQVLEEENIELMKENKDLRKELSSVKDHVNSMKMKGGNVSSSSSTTKVTPMKRGDVVENDPTSANKSFGSGSKRYDSMVLKGRDSSTKKKQTTTPAAYVNPFDAVDDDGKILEDLDASSSPLSPMDSNTATNTANVRGKREKIVAKPLMSVNPSAATVTDEAIEEPGECNQS